MKHKHSELIKRWADDTSLVRLVKLDSGEGFLWSESLHQGADMLWLGDVEYFLVCEKHVEVALHWLNGGEVDVWSVVGWGGISEPHFDLTCKYRVKPKIEKVKVWVGIHKEDGGSIIMTNDYDNYFYGELYTWTQVEVDKEVL